MNLNELRFGFIISYLMVVSIILYPIIVPALKPKETGFISFSVLGEDGSTENYFPDKISSIQKDQQVIWTLRVANKLGAATYILVKVKICTSDFPSPDSDLCIPSNAQEIFRFKEIILDDEDMTIPFLWEITSLQNNSQSLVIESMLINSETIMNDIILDGREAKMIFEVWMCEPESGEFQFTYDIGARRVCVWNQIYFNLIKEQGSD